jgi:hypothetical protein
MEFGRQFVVPRGLFRRCANICLATKPFDMQRVSAATNGAILMILLRISGGDIERYHDLLATGITKIRRFFLHFKRFTQCRFFSLRPLVPAEFSSIGTSGRVDNRHGWNRDYNPHDLQVAGPLL